MSWELTHRGRILFGDYFRRLKPEFNDFEITQDGHSAWVVTCPGRGIPAYPLAKFKGTYANAHKALKMQLITSRLTS